MGEIVKTGEPKNEKDLLTGVLIGGALGIAVGAVAAILARLFIGIIRRIIQGDNGKKKFDPRWLLQ
jgi:hypothetical protein